MVALLLLANTINIGADIGAMGAAAQLLVPLPLLLITAVFALAVVASEVFIPVGCIYQVKLPDAHACIPEAGHLVAGG
jgi:hypothetical protein